MYLNFYAWDYKKKINRLKRLKIPFKKLYLRLMNLIEFFEENYPKIKVEGFDSKFLPHTLLKTHLDCNFSQRELLGHSFLGNDIYLLKIGCGSKKILVWSQMHGNESTGTKAMLDVFEFLKLGHKISQNLTEKLSLYFIPMLNPDGAERYMRRNSCGIDLNRDFVKEASVEIKLLKKAVYELRPDFLFNLHDQRTIFNVGGTPRPATLSLLAPSPDKSRSVTPERKQSMEVIAYIYNRLQSILPGHIARFSDEFYPTSTGDNFMLEGFANILFEAGHYPNDYERKHVRRFNALALLLAMEKIADDKESNAEVYVKIPENDKKSLDVLLRNVLLKSENAESLIDFGIYFEEKLNQESGQLEWFSKIEEIGDLSAYYGHLEIDMNGKEYCGHSSILPEPGQLADFSVGDIHFDQGRFCNKMNSGASKTISH